MDLSHQNVVDSLGERQGLASAVEVRAEAGDPGLIWITDHGSLRCGD